MKGTYTLRCEKNTEGKEQQWQCQIVEGKRYYKVGNTDKSSCYCRSQPARKKTKTTVAQYNKRKIVNKSPVIPIRLYRPTRHRKQSHNTQLKKTQKQIGRGTSAVVEKGVRNRIMYRRRWRWRSSVEGNQTIRPSPLPEVLIATPDSPSNP
jgi:hypothetical protein